jgi:hypothetical protein
MHDAGFVWWGMGTAALAVLLVAVYRFAPGARLRRRLKKTHSRIISKSDRPSVKFSVKTPKE